MEFEKRKIKLLILSGKARSGKNTVAELIENYYREKKSIELSYAYYLKDYIKRMGLWDGNEETKPRTLLQELGTTLIRKKIDPNFLINRVIEDIEVYSYFYDVIIITDARLVDEIELVKKEYPKAISIQVTRVEPNETLTDLQQKHITETGLDQYHAYDYTIENDGSLEELNEKVTKLLSDIDKVIS